MRRNYLSIDGKSCVGILNKISANDICLTMLFKVGGTFSGIIVLKVYHLDRYSHDHVATLS